MKATMIHFLGTEDKTMLKKKTLRELRRALKNLSPGNSPTHDRTLHQLSRFTPYSKAELDYFREMLVTMREETLEDLKMIRAEHGSALGGNHPQRLQSLNKALLRIEQGNYGRCVSCSIRIEKERLEAIPYTQHCIRCKHVRK